MHNVVRMRECNRFTNFLEGPQALRHAAQLGRMLIESLPLHQFHGVEHTAIG